MANLHKNHGAMSLILDCTHNKVPRHRKNDATYPLELCLCYHKKLPHQNLLR
jgi:hypothetical protein